ncbi:MAG: alginate lyase family protein [Cyclobacteriaceae bacterium]
MKNILHKLNELSAIIFFFILTISCQPEEAPLQGLLYANPDVMLKIKNAYKNGSKLDAETVKRIVSCAEGKMDFKPVSVMDKGVTPPSGDKHDYISQGPYWWPDTTKEDGLPYIRRDGVVNPERNKFSDRQNLRDLIDASQLLSQAYYFTNNEKYAEKTITLLKVWFIEEATRMNPHLEYGQGIPGITEGRGIGIIETRTIGKLVDVVIVLRKSPLWKGEMQNGMTLWMRDYLDWLQNSEKGKKESIHPNNHGTWYDVQAMSLAIFTGQNDVARSIAENAKEVRFDEHVKADGSQPKELARTKSFSYSAMNLQGLFYIALLAEKVDVDLWNYKNKQGATLQDALDFLLPAALGKQLWQHEQISKVHPSSLAFHTRLASTKYNASYGQAHAELFVIEKSDDCSTNYLFY